MDAILRQQLKIKVMDIINDEFGVTDIDSVIIDEILSNLESKYDQNNNVSDNEIHNMIALVLILNNILVDTDWR